MKRGLQFPWREAGPPNYLDDKVDADQYVLNKEPSLSASRRTPLSIRKGLEMLSLEQLLLKWGWGLLVGVPKLLFFFFMTLEPGVE